MEINQATTRLIERSDLSLDEMASVMEKIMTGQCNDAQIAGFLVALRMKGETIDEITGAAQVMRKLVSGVQVKSDHAVDIVGTGGDGANLFNVSTASSFVVAAAGGTVAKHGNRSVSSKSGAADLLEVAGVNINLNPEQVQRAIETVGVGFMFAPMHHSAMKHAIGARKALGLRTIFNVLGPLTNPAGVNKQVIGVFDKSLCRPMVEAFQRLGSNHTLVVHSEDGLDEFSIAAPSHVAELKDGEIKEYEISPEQVGLSTQSLEGLMVDGASKSYQLIQDALTKQATESGAKAADIIAFNAGSAIYVSGLADSIQEGVAMAQDAIATGLAMEKLKELVSFTEIFIEEVVS